MEISVIIPTYKPQSYLWECLESVRNQTIESSNFEVLLVLNGCFEPYKSQIKEYLSNNNMKNVRFFQINEPGVSNARNMALDNAKGRYITFLDDDDIISENYLLSLIENADENVLVVSDVKVFSKRIFETSNDYISKAFLRFKDNECNNIFLKRSFLSSSCCKIIPKAIIGDVRFNTLLSLGEDSLFMFSISKNIKEIRLANNAVYYRRCRFGSASRTEKSIPFKIRTCFIQIIEYFRIYFTCPFKYNILLLLSRVIASLLHIIK